ncbi:hypothetical protein [Parvicella tangerina]|uniref:Uncharacterized protein n=1 Tax=Parvicella tangerina TaxID=2829795 RepID=A0A916NB52_9FLAO|nr:hypothetical protein [Parvicella tangerina]CAG5082248.1 hypothetical protein CRYO30217_01853 [Parvicella tangerina]
MDAGKMIVETCSDLMQGIAEQENVPTQNVGIRIDLESQKAKPVLSVFDKAKFLRRIYIKEMAKASGVGAMSGLISMSIRKIVKSIFDYGVTQYELATTTQMFLLIHLKPEKDEMQLSTAIALYIKGQMKECKLLADILAQAQNG